jgi:galactokinase
MVEADEQGGRRILAGVPGGYACSIEQVDRIVDRALALPGVLGAQIAGAGLGGCCMVLVTTDRAAALADELQGFAGGPVYICDSVGGAGLLPPPR